METGYFIADAPFVRPCEVNSVNANVKVSFAHRTFQEFFAAIHIVMQTENDKSLQTIFDEANCEFLEKNAQIFMLAVGIASTIDERKTVLELILNTILRNLIQLTNEKSINANANMKKRS